MNLTEAINEAFDAYTAAGDGSFELLSERHRVLIAVWSLMGEVDNGGFDQFYFNSSGDYAWFVPQALRLIGAETTAAIVERGNAYFQPRGPLPDRDARWVQLEAVCEAHDGRWDDELNDAFYNTTDDLDGLLVEHFGLSGRE